MNDRGGLSLVIMECRQDARVNIPVIVKRIVGLQDLSHVRQVCIVNLLLILQINLRHVGVQRVQNVVMASILIHISCAT